MHLKRTCKGFTLIELLIVVAIISIVASLSVIGMNAIGTKPRNGKIDDLIKMVRIARDNAIIKGKPHALDYDEEAVYLLVYDKQNIEPETGDNESADESDNSETIALSASRFSDKKMEDQWVKQGLSERTSEQEPVSLWQQSPLIKPLVFINQLSLSMPKSSLRWREKQEGQQPSLFNAPKGGSENPTQERLFRPHIIFWPAGYVKPTGTIQIINLETNVLTNLTIDFRGKVTIDSYE